MKTLGLLALTLAACTSSSTSIASGTLAGKVEGQSWTFVAGSTDAFLSQNQSDFFAVMYPTTYTACGAEPTGPHLIVSVPKVAGDYDLDLSRNLTFTDGASDNKIATDGRIVVDTVTDTMVSGGLHGTFDDQNEVNGHFTLTVCAPMP